MNIAIDEQTRAEQAQILAAQRRKRQRVAASALLGAMALLAVGAWWLLWGRFFESTDDAYVRADWVAVSARVNGYVAQVLVEDDQPVQAGQVLLRIRQDDYQAHEQRASAGLQEARAALLAAQAERQVAEAAVAHQRQAIDQARAALTASEAEQRRSDLDLRRYQGLVRDQAATTQRLESAQASAAQARGARQAAQASLAGEQRRLDMLQAQIAQADAHIAQAQAARQAAEADLQLAEQALHDTEVRAPVAGVVGQRRVREGQYLVPGQPLLAVVPVDQAYVVANFKETQLQHMRPGQPVSIQVDSYPDTPLHGQVSSVSPASGSVFALLPSDNATGNFTKIVQRFPVRIRLDAGTSQPILPGMSVIATVDTHQREVHR
ncbi:HlyD family secretion protein [uncultured Pseudomonas sp.]|uniref:HlyD family secretion protein n=1 Tax=uncultured Pseudomonas sp. TaxID=114707 RepID=UPI0025E418DB|nr:HlyD family secretion protein [uncultured Pseudomonas sp.]